MRLTRPKIEAVHMLVSRYLGTGCATYLFGSRLNDNARGGDVDLLVETPSNVSRLVIARLKAALEESLNLPVDLLVVREDEEPSAFIRMIRSESVSLPGNI